MQVATVASVHRVKQTNKRVSVVVIRIHAVLASLLAVRQGFSDCYVYVQLDTDTSLHSMKTNQGWALLLICVLVPLRRACIRHDKVSATVTLTCRCPLLRANIECNKQRGGFRYCYAYVWATPPYPPSFSLSYCCD